MQNITEISRWDMNTSDSTLGDFICAALYKRDNYFTLSSDTVDVNELRSRGYRLGSGINEIKYFIYHRGNFCGVLV